jgi:hypothetical protein
MIAVLHVSLPRKPHALGHFAIMSRLIYFGVVLIQVRKFPDQIPVHLIIIQRLIVHYRFCEVIIIGQYKLLAEIFCRATTHGMRCAISSRPVPGVKPDVALLFL